MYKRHWVAAIFKSEYLNIRWASKLSSKFSELAPSIIWDITSHDFGSDYI